MNPEAIGKKYDKISKWWNKRHINGKYGIDQLNRAIEYCPVKEKALDVGCGSGGRFINILKESNYSITGLDISSEMIDLASLNHPTENFIHQDICKWEGAEKYNLIIAWDSIFHLPLSEHEPVLDKLCRHLAPKGVLLYTFGNDVGEHTDQWHSDTFYYSSIGINKNISFLMENGLTILHLELDQYPENHVYTIAQKP
jgi:2-polyprenyl-3-methyl-5-hydroxy-6-metoxy-1,4-benzoquinol methylase